LNNIVTNLINDEKNSFKGKKLLASGAEALSFSDITNQLRQTYTSSGNSVVNRSELIQKLVNNSHLFFHGNTHVINFNFMMNFLEAKSPQFTEYESASALIGNNFRSFGEYYAEKALKTDDRISAVVEEEPEDLRLPLLQNYYNISLD